MKSILFAAFMLEAAFLSFAQGQNNWGWRGQPPAAPETVSVSGTLMLSNGRIALQNNDIVYYLGGLNRFIGFIDGLKEGAKVNVDGFAWTDPNDAKSKFVRVTKLNLNGKDYEISPKENTPSMLGPKGGGRQDCWGPGGHGGGRRHRGW